MSKRTSAAAIRCACCGDTGSVPDLFSDGSRPCSRCRLEAWRRWHAAQHPQPPEPIETTGEAL